MTSIPVLGYTVVVEDGAIDSVGAVARQAAPAHRYAIITDEHVGAHYAGRVVRSFGGDAPVVLTIPAGEAEKTRTRWASLTDDLLAAGFGRDSAIIALGGGVVGDLAGFVAATYMRGIPYIQLPTTLLAMVDSSIGGKTGVDTAAGKNLVGAFHQPLDVVIDPQTLSTLPVAQLCSGMAEIIKHGVIADEQYFEQVSDEIPALVGEGPAASGDALTAIIARSVAIKADVVRRDERESGIRRVLNFGHTLGHAIEHASGYRILHGEAIGIGMVLEARLAEAIGVALPGTAERIRRVVDAALLPTGPAPALKREAILEATRADKKAAGRQVRYALPSRIGGMAGEESGWAVTVDDEKVRQILD